MESPVVLDKPPEYHSNGSQDIERGFPFDDEEGSGDRWSSLAARHPDIAARLRARPVWGRKRRSSQPGQDPPADDFVSGLGEHFNRFPFDDIPSEFREHFPEHFGQRHAPQEPVHPTTQHSQSGPERSTTATQTEADPVPNARGTPSGSLPQYGLRNTVDLGQKTPADPSLLDTDDRSQRSMSAPPDNRVPHNQHSMGNMTGGHQQPPQQEEHANQHANQHGGQPNVRHIPIFVEGRDEPVITKKHPEPSAPEPQSHPQQQYAPSPPQRQYFDREPDMDFHHPNYSRPFSGSPFAKGFRAPTHQPFAPHMAYAQGRSQSPNQTAHPQHTQVPVHHEPPKQPNHQHPQQHQHFRQQSPQPSHHQQAPPQPQPQQMPPPQTPPKQATPPPQPPINDPISKILNIQKNVLDLMTEVEGFVGNKSDKKYIYLDEMLTRNLIKLDDIETEGKENIRLARKEAIKCIQKCIAVLEAKAEGRIPSTPQPKANDEQPEFNKQDNAAEAEQTNATKEHSEDKVEDKQNAVDDNLNSEAALSAANEAQEPSEEAKPVANEAKGTPKKTKKVVKKRDKSKDNNAAEIAKPNEKSADVEMKESKADNASQMETDAAAVSSQ